ncbi:MAG: hypothetical protein ACE5EB_00385 [Thermodesulfobacteriota bacterium]
MWPFSRPSPRDFYSREKIILSIRESNNFNPDESLETAGGFVIHEDALERTWLVATKLRVYSILDDRRRIEPWINWSVSRSRIFSGGKFILDIKSRPLDEKNGLVDIGYRKGNRYTKGLFERGGIAEKIKTLILEKMLH